MSQNFHERFERAEIALPSDRSTGLVFAAIAGGVVYVWRSDFTIAVIAGAAALTLVASSLLRPTLLRPLNVAWMRLAHLLSKIVNPIAMLILFALVIVPAGLLMRLGYDPLRKQRLPGVESYWIERGRAERSDMTQQF
jgi:Saxitoxin biosynthesis operon protein SxtJ